MTTPGNCRLIRCRVSRAVRRAVWVLFVALPLLGGAVANAVEFEWVPVNASGDHTLNGDEILLEGGGQTVTLHFMMSGWDPTGVVTLGSYQGTVEAGGYLGENADPPRPGVDLSPVGQPNMGFEGAFMALKVCTGLPYGCDSGEQDLLSTCTSSAHCAAGELCLDRCDHVYFELESTCTVSTATIDYSWSCASTVCAPDPDGTTKFYGGTLLLEVPPGAIGTYTVDFYNNLNFTLAATCPGPLFGTVDLTPALITILCSTDQDCDDGNACTDDICDVQGSCQNPPNYDEVMFCCDPVTGDLTPVDDDNECTQDICNPDGSVDHVPTPNEPCGGPPVDQCDAQNTCDATGNCVEHDAPVGSACGDPSDSECDQPDTCDGAGSCLANHLPEATACGDPAASQCDDPDTCDGVGDCRPNHVPPGTACDDGLFCTINEVCGGGECGSGTFTCDDAVRCTVDTCDEVNETCDNAPDDTACNNGQYCDGLEICDAADDCIVEPGSVPDCGDGIGCTDDSCDEVDDTCVNQPNDAHCNNGQFCDGVELCDGADDCVVESGSVPNCDDGIDCTDDSCDEAADTCVNAPNDTWCTDDGLFCTGPEICDPGAGCISEGCPCGTDCAIACDEDNDTCLCDPPIAEAVGSRYLSIALQPPDSTAPQALTIVPYCPDGVLRYVGPPEPFDMDFDGTLDAFVARVVDDPNDAAWLLPAEWGSPLYVTGLYVAPGTEYVIQADCGAPGEPSFSDSTTATTWRLGDVNNDTYTNITDIQRLKFGFQRDFRLNILPNLDLLGGGFGTEGICDPQQLINVSDILQGILAIRGVPYTVIGCPRDCPPCIAVVHCNDGDACTVDSCNIDGSCTNVIDYDDDAFCCNPADHDLTAISDADPCTIDSCDSETGEVAHVAIDCDDGFECTVDECIGGACFNTYFEEIECVSNVDCPDTSAGCDGFHCTCPGAPAAVIEWLPITATREYTIDENNITVGAGASEVTLHLFVSNWDYAGMDKKLRAIQSTVDPSGYLGENAVPANVGADLNPLGWPETPGDGAFQNYRVCQNLDCLFDPASPTCTWDPLSDCPGDTCEEPLSMCATRPDWVVPVGAFIAVVAIGEFDYKWGAIARDNTSNCTPDDGTRRYFGTLILEVPWAANGTYTIGFDVDPNFSLINSCWQTPVKPIRFIPATITIGAGR